MIQNLAIGLLCAFVSALSAFLFNRFNQNALRRISILDKISEGYLALLANYETLCVDYWATAFSLNKDDEIRKNEAKIKIYILSLRRFDTEFTKHIKKIKEPDATRKKLLDELFDIVTQGDFESKQRKSNKFICSSIMKKVIVIRMDIISRTHL